MTSAQSTELIDFKIDSVEKLKSVAEKEINRLNQVLIQMNQEKLGIEKANKYRQGVTIHCKGPTKIYQKRGTWSEILDTIPKGFTLLAYDYESNYYLVEFDTLLGFVFTLDVETDDRHTRRLQDEKMKIETLEAQRRASKLLSEAQKRESEAKIAERKARLLKKYGGSIGEKIIKGEIWLGMTNEMVQDSWGKPRSVNRSVGSWGIHEQWVYGNSYIYIRNGTLTSWQD
jgi:hypothetical protein